MKKTVGILVLLLFIFACREQKKNSVAEKLNDDIMKIHDEAMSKSAYVLKLKGKVNVLLDSLNIPFDRDTLQQLSSDLYKADRLMLDWMHQYKEPDLKSDTAERYLQKQLDMITEVHEITFKSIQSAERILYEK
ncbi:MAG: hypothetical protein EBZ58_05465 [Bacteroidetes bacterium]|nr:hypothetical protein [Bacteroidota bacterium]